jgi:hypothetical protein
VGSFFLGGGGGMRVWGTGEGRAAKVGLGAGQPPSPAHPWHRCICCCCLQRGYIGQQTRPHPLPVLILRISCRRCICTAGGGGVVFKMQQLDNGWWETKEGCFLQSCVAASCASCRSPCLSCSCASCLAALLQLLTSVPVAVFLLQSTGYHVLSHLPPPPACPCC